MRPLRPILLSCFTLALLTPLADAWAQARLSQRPLIVAHRGRASADQPENSLAQMQQVAGLKVAVEMDLASSRDGVLYLLHDDTLDRTTDGHGPIGAQDSTALDALHLKDGKGQVTAQSLPRLTQVLDWAAGVPDVLLMLDLKGTPVSKVAPLLQARQLAGRTILLTFDRPHAIEALRHANGAMVSVLVNTGSDIAYYQRIAAGRPLAMYVPQGAKSSRYADAHDAGAVVISDVNQDALTGTDILADQVAKDGCRAYLDYVGKYHIDALVTNRPTCAAEPLK
ncbi:glycerophosphodiester phosphodiesterase family protein [Pseudoxanthomonas sp. JBR18]|uniref:glycerophosphodiester phosphodiesterase family protein n=1 Tax=Pseudoxanthomonas sp. JBR18 TaxID=2969308 RepID=UPI002305508C|nr:glycerophosphodiester phosphodiesterase family protein [Pseudoxanthomonas sp. JBR18]WCE05028.1 glycerophosphodiester phosphodiesterase family protein [Pseudoxanthomonas sp. JBR18]